jgi:electron transfer flavoprotein-quinone oxidoreductase
MEEFDVVIVGGGLSGLFCAHRLAGAGMKILLIERGEYCGSKNLTGGRLYFGPIKELLADMWHELPIERKVIRERLSVVASHGSLTFDFFHERFREPHSFTLLRAKFDKWLAERVSKRGVMMLTGYRVDDLLVKDGQVKGVMVQGEAVGANVVIAADGALSFLSEKASLRARRPEAFAVGIKEVIELDEGKIEDRFGVERGEGVAHLFFGQPTGGVFGGAFLYTNSSTISLGLVLGIGSLIRNGKSRVSELLEVFKERYEVRRFIEGGRTVEYSAHLIPELGLAPTSRLVGNGIMLVGDAAGFALNMGFTVRGMEFAIASGILAAETAKEAKKRGDFSERTLSGYERRLRESFVLEDMGRFSKIPFILQDEALHSLWPYRFIDFLHDLYSFDRMPKERMGRAFWKLLRGSVLNLWGIRKVLQLRDV